MVDPIQALLNAGVVKTTTFPPNSRYQNVATATLETTDGKTIVYLRRRFVPPPERFALVQEHLVTQGDRLDILAARYLGDPEMFWLLCDANGAVRPEELIEAVGKRLRITLPEGLTGATLA